MKSNSLIQYASNSLNATKTQPTNTKKIGQEFFAQNIFPSFFATHRRTCWSINPNLQVEPIGGFHLPACQAWFSASLGKAHPNPPNVDVEDLKLFHQIYNYNASENGKSNFVQDRFLLDP